VNFNIKKLSNPSIYLYIVFFILFKYIDNKSFFDFNILKETFNKHELTENFPIKNKYFESIILIKSNNLMSYRLSNEIIDDVYTKYKIIISTYPLRYDISSNFFIFKSKEQIPDNCSLLENKKYLKLVKC